ncbi:MAG: hypothetical protein HY088_02995 [Ignavibacteriales bacterium]|nr:hypothetical protein [Ignavibacteriales bacterium]
MSLKAFHIFFITVSTLCTFGFAAWLLLNDTASLSLLNILEAIAAFACGVALILYGIRFLRKFKHLSYM